MNIPLKIFCSEYHSQWSPVPSLPCLRLPPLRVISSAVPRQTTAATKKVDYPRPIESEGRSARRRGNTGADVVSESPLFVDSADVSRPQPRKKPQKPTGRNGADSPLPYWSSISFCPRIYYPINKATSSPSHFAETLLERWQNAWLSFKKKRSIAQSKIQVIPDGSVCPLHNLSDL